MFFVSIIGFIFSAEKNFCKANLTSEICSNPFFKVCLVSALVIGFFLAFVGLIIVIYTKKDSNAKVIILQPTRYYSNNSEQFLKKQDESVLENSRLQSNSQQHQRKNESEPLKKEKEDTIDMNEYNYVRNNSLISRE